MELRAARTSNTSGALADNGRAGAAASQRLISAAAYARRFGARDAHLGACSEAECFADLRQLGFGARDALGQIRTYRSAR